MTQEVRAGPPSPGDFILPDPNLPLLAPAPAGPCPPPQRPGPDHTGAKDPCVGYTRAAQVGASVWQGGTSLGAITHP